MLSKVLILFSYVAVVLAAMESLGRDVFLASTQWLLVGIMLTVWAIYILVEAHLRHK